MATQKDIQFLREAVKLANEAVEKGIPPFGAVVVKDGEVVATGINEMHCPIYHAEVTAIRNACKALDTFHLNGCTLYSSCYPCPMCMGACLWAHLDRVVYGCAAEEANEAGFDDKKFYEFIENGAKKGDLKVIQMILPHNQNEQPFSNWKSRESQ